MDFAVRKLTHIKANAKHMADTDSRLDSEASGLGADQIRNVLVCDVDALGAPRGT